MGAGSTHKISVDPAEAKMKAQALDPEADPGDEVEVEDHKGTTHTLSSDETEIPDDAEAAWAAEKAAYQVGYDKVTVVTDYGEENPHGGSPPPQGWAQNTAMPVANKETKSAGKSASSSSSAKSS